MSEPPTSLAQLGAQVEKLTATLAFNPQDHAWLPPADADSSDGAPRLSEAALAALVEARRAELAAVEAEEARRRSLIARAEKRILAESADLGRAEERAERELAEANQRLAAVEAELKEASSQARTLRERHHRYQEWLDGVSPLGLNRFQDAQGRQVGQALIAQTQVRVRELAGKLRLRLALAQDSLNRQRREAALVARCGHALDQARQARRQAEDRLRQQAEAVAQRQAGLSGLAARRIEARRDLNRALSLQQLHAQAMNELAERIAAALPAPAPGPDAPAAARQELERALGEARRAGRLGELVVRVERRLSLRQPTALALLGSVRDINREVRALEQELPGLVAPLTSADTARPRARSEAAAGLSTLTARLQDLAPQARQAHAEFKQLKALLGLWVERGKTWQDAWRAAAKAERGHLEQAQALIAEARQAAAALREQARADGEALAPVLELAAHLGSADLEPLLTRWRERQDDLFGLAQTREEAAQALEAALPAPSVASLSKPPAALKPHAALVRRLSGRRVEVDRLVAMLRAAQGWRGILAEPVLAAARRPAEEVALTLAGSLSRLATEAQRLRDNRGRTVERLIALRQDLENERQESARTREDLASNQRDLARTWDLAQDLEDELQRTRREGRANEERAEERLAAAKAEASEREAALRAELERQRADSQRSVARLESELLGQDEARAQAERELKQVRADLERRSRQAAELEQELLSAERGAREQGRELDAQRDARRRAQADLSRLRAELSRRAEAAALLEEDLARGRAREQALTAELTATRQEADLAHHHLSLAQGRNYRLKRQLEQTENQLALARQGQLAAAELVRRLDSAELANQGLAARLAQSERLAQALKAKALERHRLYRQAMAALAPLPYWQNEARAHEIRSESLRAEVKQVRRQLEQARSELRAALTARDLAEARLAQEQSARAQQALDMLQGQGLALELSASQGEAERWARLAQGLALALAASGHAHQEEVAALGAAAAEQAAQAQHLKLQLDRMALLTALVSAPGRGHAPAPAAQPGQPVRVRVTSLTPAQMDRLMDRLAAVRGRLKKIGRTTLGYWALIAALTAGLTLLAPGTPSKANRRISPLVEPAQSVQQAGASLNLAPGFAVGASARALADAGGEAKLELNLMPLRQRANPLTSETRAQLAALARRAGLSPQVLLTSAQAAFGPSALVDMKAMEELADTAHDLAKRHPLIFRELSNQGLPKNAAALAALDPAPEKAQALFLDRLYREYRSLGFAPEEALGALTANERAVGALKDAWQVPLVFSGQVRPVTEIETLTLNEFLERITPYIETRLNSYLKLGGVSFTGDVGLYAKNLAFDIYCAAKKFGVPVSVMLVIAHQETSYANVLGDSNLSASPFQIYAPTRKLIVASLARNRFVAPPTDLRLEHHLTMATYMAAYHLRELLLEATLAPSGQRPAMVDMDRVMKRYNGSDAYAGQVAQRQKQLVGFLRNS